MWLVYWEKKKNEFYGNLNISVLTENKTVKPFLTEKSKKLSKIT